jgi:hypothetical protein
VSWELAIYRTAARPSRHDDNSRRLHRPCSSHRRGQAEEDGSIEKLIGTK